MNKLLQDGLQPSFTAKNQLDAKYVRLLLNNPEFQLAMEKYGHEKAIAKFGLNPLEVYKFVSSSPALLKQFVRRKA